MQSCVSLKNWNSLDDFEMNYENLNLLFENKIPCIRVSGFASKKECIQLERSVAKVGFDFYENVFPPIGRIGITQFEYSGKDKVDYFLRASKANDVYRRITSMANFSPLDRLIYILNHNIDKNADIAFEDDVDASYFAGLFRQISVALLHVDFARLDAPGWKIGDVVSQLAWNLYITPPENGGSCNVYNRPWQLNDESRKITGSYGYDSSLVENVEYKSNAPIIGDLVIFNSRNFHEVTQANGDRLTCSSFIGKLPDGNLVLWS